MVKKWYKIHENISEWLKILTIICFDHFNIYFKKIYCILRDKSLVVDDLVYYDFHFSFQAGGRGAFAMFIGLSARIIRMCVRVCVFARTWFEFNSSNSSPHHENWGQVITW